MTPHIRLPRLFNVDQVAEQLAVSSRRSAGGSSGASGMSIASAASFASPRMTSLPTSRGCAGNVIRRISMPSPLLHCIHLWLLLYVYILILF